MFEIRWYRENKPMVKSWPVATLMKNEKCLIIIYLFCVQENRGIDPPEGPHPIKYFKSPNPKTNENDLLTNLTSFTEGKKKEERLIDSTHTHSLALNRRKRSLHCVIEAKEEKKRARRIQTNVTRVCRWEKIFSWSDASSAEIENAFWKEPLFITKWI